MRAVVWLVVAGGAFLLIVQQIVVGRLSPEEAERIRAALSRGALLVDVRTLSEYEDGHLPGAHNVPLGELSARVAELGPRDRLLVVYCRTGSRSRQAVAWLVGQGFEALDLRTRDNWAEVAPSAR